MHEAARAAFAELVSEPEARWDLARAALLVACQEYPELLVDDYMQLLDRWGEALMRRVGPDTQPREALEALNVLLFTEQGMRGNVDDYYDPRNSLLNDVLDRRMGIPITVSLVYIEVGRRAGLSLAGVSLPGHFIAKLERASGEDIYVDPFNGGEELSVDDCRTRALRYLVGPEAWSVGFLVASPRREILARILRNLKAIYASSDAMEHLLWVCDLLAVTCPDRLEEVRDRGLVQFNLRHYARAAADLSTYLEGGDTDDRVRIQDVLRHARRMLAMMN